MNRGVPDNDVPDNRSMTTEQPVQAGRKVLFAELKKLRLLPPELTAPPQLPPPPPPRLPPPLPPLPPRLPPPQITPLQAQIPTPPPEQITPAPPPTQKKEIKNISDLILSILLFIVIFGVSSIVPILFLTHSDTDTTTTTDTETTTDTNTNTNINTILSIICIVISFLISLFLFINKIYDNQLLNVILIVLMIANVVITVIIYDNLNKLNNKNKDLFWINVLPWVVYFIFFLAKFAEAWNDRPTTYQHTKT